MPEESLTNLKLLSNVVADYNYDYFIIDDGLKFHLVIISYWSIYKEWVYMWKRKRNVVIKKATRELFVVLSDEIKRKSAYKLTICHSSQLDTPFFCYIIYISLIQGSKLLCSFFCSVLCSYSFFVALLDFVSIFSFVTDACRYALSYIRLKQQIMIFDKHNNQYD